MCVSVSASASAVVLLCVCVCVCVSLCLCCGALKGYLDLEEGCVCVCVCKKWSDIVISVFPAVSLRKASLDRNTGCGRNQ